MLTFIDEDRGTGRTTRMLKSAIEKSKNSDGVVVIVGHNREFKYCLSRIIPEIWTYPNIKYEYLGSPNLIITTGGLSVRGVHYENILIDHHAKDILFDRIIGKWFKYYDS